MTERVGRGAFKPGENCPTGYYALKGTTNVRDRVGAKWFFDQSLDPLCDNLQALNRGVVAIQKRLNTLGFKPRITANGIFGVTTDAGVRWFQERFGVPGGADGLCGPNTCKYLFAGIRTEVEDLYDVPFDLVYKVSSQESQFDPGAVGQSTPDDKSIGQINLQWHPEVTLTQAFAPKFALDFTGKYLQGKHRAYKPRFAAPEDAWYCAVVAYNNPANAEKWANTGTLNEPGQNYLNMVLGQKVVPA